MFRRRWQREAEARLRVRMVEEEASAVMWSAVTDLQFDALDLAVEGLAAKLNGDPEEADEKIRRARTSLDQIKPFLGADEE